MDGWDGMDGLLLDEEEVKINLSQVQDQDNAIKEEKISRSQSSER
jgi:hypothetical protein